MWLSVATQCIDLSQIVAEVETEQKGTFYKLCWELLRLCMSKYSENNSTFVFSLFICSFHESGQQNLCTLHFQVNTSMIGKEQQEENISYICLPPTWTFFFLKREKMVSHYCCKYWHVNTCLFSFSSSSRMESPAPTCFEWFCIGTRLCFTSQNKEP